MASDRNLATADLDGQDPCMTIGCYNSNKQYYSNMMVINSHLKDALTVCHIGCQVFTTTRAQLKEGIREGRGKERQREI